MSAKIIRPWDNSLYVGIAFALFASALVLEVLCMQIVAFLYQAAPSLSKFHHLFLKPFSTDYYSFQELISHGTSYPPFPSQNPTTHLVSNLLEFSLLNGCLLSRYIRDESHCH